MRKDSTTSERRGKWRPDRVTTADIKQKPQNDQLGNKTKQTIGPHRRGVTNNRHGNTQRETPEIKQE
jgi:hypothetical protein